MKGYDASTYGDRFADIYDDWYADVSDVEGTVDHVVELAAQVTGTADAAVLELGGGSGRIAVPLAERGLEVWTVDASPAMLDRLRAKPGGERVRAVLGDMSELALGDAAPPFAVAFCAFNTLFNLTSEDAQRRCLTRVVEVLAPGGRFVVEAFVPPPLDEHDLPVDAVEPRHIGLDDVVLSVSRIEPATRMMTGQYVQISESGIRLRPWMMHYASPEQLDELAASVGLRLIERHGGWYGEAFREFASSHVSTYERA